MDARYYNSMIGRFLSVDAAFLAVSARLDDPQSLNSYSYARNNPLRYIDPDGMWFKELAAGVGGYIVGTVQGVVGGAVGTVKTVIEAPRTYYNGLKAGANLTVSLYHNRAQTVSEIKEGIGITLNEDREALRSGWDEFQTKSPYQQGKEVGNLFGHIEEAILEGHIGDAIKVKHINSVVDAGGEAGLFGRSGLITTKTRATQELRGGLNLLKGESVVSPITKISGKLRTGVEILQSGANHQQSSHKQKR